MEEIKRGKIYYANLSPVVGSEQGGIRPVLVIQNDKNNKTSTTTIVAAITSKKKKNQISHISIKGFGLRSESLILLEQVRTIDKSRLLDYIGMLDNHTMEKVDHGIVESFGIKYLEVIANGK